MTLYSHNGAWPTTLPNRIVLSNGKSRTDRSTFTDEEIADAGWVSVEAPPVVTWPNKLDWNGTNWVVREPSENEVNIRRQEIRQNCLNLLQRTDYKVLKAYEASTAVDPAIVTYRQSLRDMINNINDLDPWNIAWPSLPDEPV